MYYPQEINSHILKEKYSKSTIFDPLPNNNYNTRQNQSYKITDKITNKAYDQSFIPRYPDITSKDRYNQNLYSHKNLNPIPIPKKINSNMNLNAAQIKCRDMYDNYNVNEYRQKKIQNHSEDHFSNENINKIVKTTQDSRLRKLCSMSSNIFNVDETSAKCENRVADYMNKKSINTNNRYGENVKIKRKNSKTYLPNAILKKNSFSKIEQERKISLDRDVKEKKYNRIKIPSLNSEYTPLYKLRDNNKTNFTNIESVKYDIISTQNNELNNQYSHLSNLKAAPEEIENYEIIVPHNYNKMQEIKIKNILGDEGMHYFNLKEEGDIVGGEKGRYLFNVRRSSLEKDNNNQVKNITKKLNKLNVKFHKIIPNRAKIKCESIKNCNEIENEVEKLQFRCGINNIRQKNDNFNRKINYMLSPGSRREPKLYLKDNNKTSVTKSTLENIGVRYNSNNGKMFK